SGKLGVEFTGPNSLGQGIEDRRKRRKLANGDGILVLGELDWLSGITQTEEGLATGIDEPASAKALRGFDLDPLTFLILTPDHMGRRIVLPSNFGFRHGFLLG